MKNILIFLSILIICMIAFVDTKDRFASLDQTSSSKTPAQSEILAPLNRKNIDSKSLDFQENTKNMHDKFRKDNQKIQQNNKNMLNNDMNKVKY